MLLCFFPRRAVTTRCLWTCYWGWSPLCICLETSCARRWVILAFIHRHQAHQAFTLLFLRRVTLERKCTSLRPERCRSSVDQTIRLCLWLWRQAVCSERSGELSKWESAFRTTRHELTCVYNRPQFATVFSQWRKQKNR